MLNAKSYSLEIKDAALVAAAKLSARYIRDRFQPDKSIDIVDSAFSSLRVSLDSRPPQIDQLERRKTQLEIEEISLKKESGDKARARLESVQAELEVLQEELEPLLAQFQREKGHVDEIAELKREIEVLRSEAAQHKRKRNLRKAADLLNFEIPDRKSRLRLLEDEQRQLDQKESDTPRIVQHVVTEDVVADIVAGLTGIPVQRLMSSEAQNLLNLDKRLKSVVIGQDAAVRSVAESILRSRAGLADPQKPSGVFFLAGPSGTGKTLLAKTLANELFAESKGAFLRIDCSELQEQHSVAKLIGAPPGYVGHEEGGVLTEHLRRRPFSVVLLDEIEKAHPKILDVLLQLFDEGRLTDSHGRTADGRHAVFIMTSNLGSAGLLDAQKEGSDESRRRAARRAVLDAAKSFMRPEFLNRIEISIFEPLSTDAIADIVTLEMEQLNERLRDRNIEIALDSDALELVAKSGYSTTYGARPLKRWLERHIVSPVANMLLGGAIATNSRIKVSVIKPTTKSTKSTTATAKSTATEMTEWIGASDGDEFDEHFDFDDRDSKDTGLLFTVEPQRMRLSNEKSDMNPNAN